MKNTRNLKKRGFTLLEIMVAISLIAIVLVTVLKLNIQTISMSNYAKFYATAPLLAQNKIDEIAMESSYEQISDSGNFKEEFPGYAWRISIEDVLSEELGNVAENFKQVDVTISLNDDQFTYALRTYRLVQ